MKLGYNTWSMPTLTFEEAVPHLGRLGFDSVEYGVECAVEQSLNQAIGGVITAGGLTLITFGLRSLGKCEAAPMVKKTRSQFQQAFVNGTELFGLHVPPIDRSED